MSEQAQALGSAIGFLASVHDPAAFVQGWKVLAGHTELAALLRSGLAARSLFQLDSRIVVNPTFVHGVEQQAELRAFAQNNLPTKAIFECGCTALLRGDEGCVG